MASTANATKEFFGNEEEDVGLWLKEIKMTARVVNLNEEQQTRLILFKLRGVAQTWAVSNFNSSQTITLNEVTNGLLKRFSNSKNKMERLNKFMAIKITRNKEELRKLTETATFLVSNGYMDVEPIIKLTILKCPSEIRSILYQATHEEYDWNKFLRALDNVSWLAFPDEANDINRFGREEEVLALSTVRTNPNNQYKKNSKTRREYRKGEEQDSHCVIHGNCRHTTKDCWTLKKLTENGYGLTKKHHNAIKNIQKMDNNDDELKDKYLYSNFHKSRSSNPFETIIKIDNKEYRGLLDSGADLSLIHEKTIPPHCIIHRCTLKNIRSASGDPIKIIGRVEKLDIMIDGVEYTISALVNSGNPSCTILGIDFIQNHPITMYKILDSFGKGGKTIRQTPSCNTISTAGYKQNFLEDFHMIFSDQIDSTKLCEIAKHTIDTGDAKPFKEINQRIPVHWNETISMEIDRLQKNGTIRESNSPWCSRIVPIKKEDGSLRLCIDFRRLNLITIKDSYPLPRIDEIIDKLVGSTYFTVLDATSGYNQIAIREEDIQKTAFAFNNGFYEYTRMPFGLCNAPATFQRVMDKILCKRTRCFVLPYLDDVIVFSKTLAEHNQHVRIVLEKIKGANITLNKKKCKFFQTEIKILGTIIAGNKVKPDPGKIEAIKKYPLPQKIQQLRAFLGLANYVRAYIKNYASISAKLCEILKGETKRSIKQIEWSEGAIECFKRLKQAVINITYRSQPDISKEFILTTDASSTGIGAVLSQINKNGSEEMICAFSKKLDKAQMNYSVTDRELLAVVKGIDNFRHYLLGKPFSLRTDHKALEYLWKAKNPTGRFLRWGLKLQEYTFTPIYIKGDDNFADGLSRYNDTSCIKALAIEDYTLTKDNRSNILKSLHYESGHGSKKT
ncbi:MAG: pol polyprotein, partial [Bacteroidales bacterium]